MVSRFAKLAALLLSLQLVAGAASAQTPVFINEIHYDNIGTDAGEFVEIAGPAGTDVSVCTIELYNGTGGARYDSDALTGTIPNHQNGFGTVSVGYPANGIQNGSPDGVALVCSGVVLQFLSYEGSFTATSSTAIGLTSTDIGVSQPGSEAAGLSLQLQGTGQYYQDFAWSAASVANTRDAVNAGQTFVPTTLSVNDVSVTEGDSGTVTASFTVTLSRSAPAGGVTFDIATADGTATAGSDYDARSLTGQSILFGNSTYTFDVTVNGDTSFEPAESFFVNLTNVVGAALGDGQGEGTINNDDGPPALSVSNVSVAESGGPATFTVSLSTPAAGDVTFDLATADDTASSATDYAARSVTGATILAGDLSYTFDVTINDDVLFEPDETFFVDLTNASGADVADARGLGTITNDDPIPGISIDDTSVNEGDAGPVTATLTVTLSAPAGADVTVDYTTTDSSASAGSDYTATSGTLTFASGETTKPITVDVTGDSIAENDENFFVDLSNETNALITDGRGVVSILDDDPISIFAEQIAITETFDTLAATGSSSTTPPGWRLAESGTNADGQYLANDGGSNSGNTYSYGTGTTSDRAFGGLQSGALIPMIGAFFRNDTGTTINSLYVAYAGEQWRLGTAGRTDRLDFQYSLDATSLTTGTWTDVDGLDFVTPNTLGTGAKDGNAAGNRSAVQFNITGLSIPPGATFRIRYSDFNASGADDGLAVDDFSITANPSHLLTINDVTILEGDSGTTPATFTVSLSSPAGPEGVRFDIATSDATATAGSDYVASSLPGQVIDAGLTSYTFTVGVNGDTDVEPAETFFVTVSNVTGASVVDGQGRGTISPDDFTFTPINQVQGSGNQSPLDGLTVTVDGIVTGIKVGGSGGFFLQTPDAGVDADPNTSEGIFVFTGAATPAGVVIGNRLAVTGLVSEFPASALPHTLTELTSPTVSVLATAQPLPAPMAISAAEATPSTNLSHYERFESMRVSTTLTVVAPTEGSVNEANATSTSNGVFFGVPTGVSRPMREPGVEITQTLPSGSPCCVPRFDTNPEKLRVDSDAQPGTSALNVAAGQTVSNLAGPLDYGFFQYTLLPEAATVPVVTGSIAPRPVPAPTSSELTIASFNLERFYDTIDETTPPGNGDTVITPLALANRLNKASLAIRDVLMTPDVVGVVEVENLTTLQALAAKINADAVLGGDPDPSYQAYLEEGNDVGGIDVGFLVRASRVSVVSVTQEGKTATFTNPDTLAADLLNDRPPLVLEATVARPDSSLYPFTVIVNHLRSLIGVETDDAGGRRVRAKRRAQAEFLANLVQARQTADAAERIVLVGDFNAFEMNDGYVDLIGTIKGTPAPADQVVLASTDLVNPDLTNLVDTLPAAERYSFLFDGNAQVIDHALVNSAFLPSATRVFFARVDADFPEILRNDVNRPERISDHDAIVAYFETSSALTQLSIDDITVTEGDAATAATFTVTLAPSSEATVTVQYATADGTATAVADYLAAAGTLTFAPGVTSQAVTVSIVGDILAEATETFFVNLTAPTNAVIADSQGTATIVDNDTAASADLSITKSAPSRALMGSNIPFTIVVTNAGPSAASGVTVIDILPAGTTFSSATPSQGTCSGTSTVTCSIGSLANGASATIALVVSTLATPATVSNTATVAGTEGDPNLANNTATSSTSAVAAIPALSFWVLMALAAALAGAAMVRLRL